MMFIYHRAPGVNMFFHYQASLHLSHFFSLSIIGGDAEGQLDVIPEDCRTVSLMINLRLLGGSFFKLKYCLVNILLVPSIDLIQSHLTGFVQASLLFLVQQKGFIQ